MEKWQVPRVKKKKRCSIWMHADFLKKKKYKKKGENTNFDLCTHNQKVTKSTSELHH